MWKQIQLGKEEDLQAEGFKRQRGFFCLAVHGGLLFWYLSSSCCSCYQGGDASCPSAALSDNVRCPWLAWKAVRPVGRVGLNKISSVG